MPSDAEVLLSQAAAWRHEGLEVAVATVIKTWGSSPRPAGSQLIVNGRGEIVGSVSGGCIEGAVVGTAREILADPDRRPRLLQFGVTHDMAWEVGLACGGQVEVFVEAIVPGDSGAVLNDGLLASLLTAMRQRRMVALITTIPTGEQRLLDAFTAGSEPALVDAVREAILADRPSVEEQPDSRRIFIQPFCPPVRLVIVGAVHIAQPLSQLAAVTGFEVTVVDPRTAFATASRFPGVTLVTTWPAEALAALRPDSRTAVVTLTHDPKLDDPALEAALRGDAFYIGSLGSGKTHAARLNRLRGRGFSDEVLGRIHGPVGLRIGARSPAEIAVSILAELVAELHRSAQPEKPAAGGPA